MAEEPRIIVELHTPYRREAYYPTRYAWSDDRKSLTLYFNNRTVTIFPGMYAVIIDEPEPLENVT